MIDIHTHILPNIDDGSKSVEMSAAMLAMLKAEGVTSLAATPHFYAMRTDPDTFFAKRAGAMSSISEAVIRLDLDVRLGAEVLYYDGLSRMSAIDRFVIEGTKLLLIEMPFMPWSERMISEIGEIASDQSIRIVLAHIERYMPYQHPSIWDRLCCEGILLQVGTDFIASPFSRRKAIRMFKAEQIHFIGSDCHDTSLRPPVIKRGFDVIADMLGQETAYRFNAFNSRLFSEVSV